MRASDISVIVRDRNLVRTGVVTDGFLNLRVRFRFNAPSEWELRLPKTHPAVPVLSQPGSGIILALYGQEVLSGFIKRPDEIANFENPDGTFTFTGHDDTALLFHALAYPDPTTADVTAQGQSYDTRVGNPETVMRAFVAANVAGAHSSPPHPGRLGGFRDFIELEPVNGNRGGASITKSARFENLGEVLSDVATLGGLGFRIVQRGDFLRFEVYERRDVSDLVRFDIDSGTLKSKQVQKSAPGRTRVIVGGRGEGIDREFVQRTSPDSIAAENDWNLVIEEFVSYTNAESTEELQQTGDKRLIEDGFTSVAVKAIPADDQTMRFVHDWNLGDTVGLVMYGQPVKSFVTEAVLLANKDRVSVGAAVGDLRNFDPDRVNDFRVEDTQRRVSQIERTLELGDEIDWANITGKPSTFPSTWSLVSDKPSSFPPSSHDHALSAIQVTAIGGSQNLNNYVTQGLFYQSANAQASSGSNYPVPHAGLLEVINRGDTGFVQQRYSSYADFNDVFVRGLYAGTWSAWRKISGGPWAMAAGYSGGVTVPAGGNHSASITFPSGRFNVAPRVMTNLQTEVRDITSNASGITASGFTLNRGNTGGNNRTGVTAAYIAIQMTSTSASG